MVRLVRVFKGQWSKSQQGVWRFHEDQGVLPRDILLRVNENIESLKELLRSIFNIEPQTPILLTFQLPQWMLEPEGETWPPHNIVTKADVETMLSVHEWNTEPRLCIIYGAEEVATYQFRCRAPFTIGRFTFLGEGVTEEQHLAIINDILRKNEITCSVEVVKEIFDEEKMVMLYRFSMEAEKAKNSVDLNVADKVDNGDHIVPNVGYHNGTTNIRSTAFPMNPPTAYGYPSFPTGGVASNPVPYPTYDPRYYTNSWPNMEVGQGYWESLMSSRYALELERIYGVRGSEYVGYLPTDLALVNPPSPVCHLNRNNFHIEVSSTGSSAERKTVVGMGGEVTKPSISGFGQTNAVVIEKGESSKHGVHEADDGNEPETETEG
ncbi:hypothetical protein Bca4012_019676 [Brassica carinata]